MEKVNNYGNMKVTLLLSNNITLEIYGGLQHGRINAWVNKNSQMYRSIEKQYR